MNRFWSLFAAAIPWLPIWLLRHAASLIAETRPLGRFPGWRFAIEEDRPTPLLSLRRRLWEHFKKRGVEEPVRICWFENSTLDVVLGNDQSRCLYVGGSFEPNEFAFLARFLKPGMHVVDAGASEGFYTVFLARKVAPGGRVIAVEPSPRERERLKHNIALNKLANVRVISAGLGAARGRAVLHIAEAEHNGQNTIGGFVYEGVSKLRDLEIDLMTVDQALLNTSDERIDLIKMDVEGAEMKLLLGAEHTLRTSKPVILFELLDDALRAQGSCATDIVDFLEGKGYVIFKFDEVGALSPLMDVAQASTNLVAAPASAADELQAISRW